MTDPGTIELKRKASPVAHPVLRLIIAAALWGILLLNPAGVGMAQSTKQPPAGPNFKIKYLTKGCRLVTDGAGRKLLLVPRGQKAPAGFKGVTRVPIPLHRVIFTSPTQACYLRPLQDQKIWASVVGVSTPYQQWHLSQIQTGLRQGQITYIGDSFKPDYELIRSLRPDLVFVYTGPAGQYGLINKLQALQVNYAVDNEYLESDPLARLEWLQFIAAFYCREETARRYCSAARQRIEQRQRQLTKTSRPKVAWAVIYQGKVFVPAGESYTARMIDRAGGDYIFKDQLAGCSGVQIGLEEFYRQTRTARFLIYASFPELTPDRAALTKSTPILADLAAFRHRQVWVLQPWYHQSLDRTALILEDLALLFHPQLDPQHRPGYFYRLP